MSLGSSRGRRSFAAASVVAITLAFAANARAVTFGQLDDFQESASGWTEGFSSPNQPAVVSSGGPGGAGDAFLQNVSGGGFSAGSKQVMFNQAQWTGDFNAAHVARIELKLKNLGTTPMNIHLAFAGGSFSRFGTTDGVVLPAGSGWVTAGFDLTPSKLTLILGSDTAAQALSSVTEFRILSSNGTVVSYNGDPIASTLGVDAIRATRLTGDANFDNTVGFADLVLLAQHYNQSSGATWASGDFNFDGKVAFDDLVLLAQHYNTSASVLAAGDVGDAAFRSDWALAQSLVPEPNLALLSSGGLAAAARLRRRPARVT